MENLNSYQEIQSRIARSAKAAHRTDVPELLAVSKFQSVEKILSLYQQGQRVFGENYVQELIEKRKAFDQMGLSDLKFHFIGHLQTNKVKLLLPHVDVIHSVDSLKLFSEIEKRARELQKKIGVYFQINIDQEASKGGFLPTELPSFAQTISESPWIERLGLMAIPDPEGSPSQSFQKMQELSKQWGEILGHGLSLGMSQDFEMAIGFGSTSVRVGSALFGPRE